MASESPETPQKSSETLSGHAPRFRPESVWLAALLASSAAVVLGLVIYLALHLILLKGVAPNEVIRTTLTLMAGLAAVLTGVYAYRKQRLSEADAERADDEQLTQRYSTAAEQLGHAKAAVRLAGVFAMARLADDWSKQRQQCLDVLCAYLRMPAEPGSLITESEVRATIVRIIATHLRDPSAISWVKHDFDFSGADLHNALFSGATFGGKASFDYSTFSGATSFSRAKFSGWSGKWSPSFWGATFSGDYTTFAGATFSGNAAFTWAKFSGDHATFEGATFVGASTNFFGATFSGANPTFDNAAFTGADTNFDEAKFSHTTTADEATAKASFVGGTVHWGPITPRILPSTATGTH